MAKGAICTDTRPCFGKVKWGKVVRCSALVGDSYEDGKCPFCKPKSNITGTTQYDWKPEPRY